MRSRLLKVLVTGGAGFIGSAFVRLLLDRGSSPRRGLSLDVIVVDKLTYAGDLKRLEAIKGRYKFYKTDICNRKQIKKIFKKERPQIVVNFAAETHVDRSIQDASAFLETNIKGTHVLLDAARKYKIKKFIHISSDEVYGEIKRGEFLEESPLCPNSPYAASKAAADLFIKAYIRTYSFPAIIIRPCNNYGPWQYPEKLIPLAIFKIFKNEKIPIYGDGRNIREWLYVEDCAQGILQILKKGKIGGIYNLGSQEKRQNIEVAGELLKILKKDDDMIGFIQDRPGHDIRYSLNSKKVHQQTGWLPKTKFKEGLKNTAKWYAGYKDWVFSKWKSISNLYK